MNPTTVILDFSVFAHQLHNSFASAGAEKDKHHWKGILEAQATWMLSGRWLGNLVDPNHMQLIAVCDSKPYWRKEYLLRPEVYETIQSVKRGKVVQNDKPIHYKGGRKFPEYHFTKVKEKLTEFCESVGLQFLRVPGYEADDLAASLVVTNRLQPARWKQNIILATVDADWLGLVDANTTWFCSHGWHPRVRGSMEQINEWSRRRLKTSLEKPSDIWRVKAEQGDVSDNLPAGSPIEVIDLLNPPEEHRLWETPLSKLLTRMLLEPQPLNTRVLTKVEPAVEYLRQMGIPKFIKQYDAEDKEQPSGN